MRTFPVFYLNHQPCVQDTQLLEVINKARSPYGDSITFRAYNWLTREHLHLCIVRNTAYVVARVV